ncbi:MAG: type II secretion system secretin GspD [Candidatus Hydrogenedentes bacterium]|nr:type II secretion system secretin GspD [Candidatus Hydrogenedentota bacterium]
MKVKRIARWTCIGVALGLMLAFRTWAAEAVSTQTEKSPEGEPAAESSDAPAAQPEPSGTEEQPAAKETPAAKTPAPKPTVRTTTKPGARGKPGLPGAAPANATPVSPNRPKGGVTPGEPVSLDFNGVKLVNVIEQIGIMTGKNFEVDPGIADTMVTVISQEPIAPEMAYYVLESILATKGFRLVPTLDGKWIKVLPQGEGGEKNPVIIGAGEPKGFDNFSTYVIPVKFADASELSSLLKTLGSKNARVDAYANTNTLIINDSADGIRNMLTLLKEIDIPGNDTKMEIFTLEYTRAEVVQGQIQEVLLGQDAGVRQPGAAAAPRPQVQAGASRRTQVPGQTASTIVGSREETLRIVADERLNALIVVATASMMERTRDLVNKLDTPTPWEANNMHVYELLNASAEDVENALNAVVGGTGGGSRSMSSTSSSMSRSSSSGSRPVSSPSPQYSQSSASGAGPTEQVQAFEKRVSISRYDQTNALLIVASPQDYERIKGLIAQLDVPQRQVNVEAVIMEVTISDSYELDVEATALKGNSGFGLNNVVNLANILASGPLAAAGSGLTAGYLRGTTKVPVSAGGVTTIQTIPNVPLLLKAIEQLTTVDVLSNPLITTVDNKEAELTIGQQVPTPAAVNSGETGLVIQNRIERKDVGVKLKVTPQINEGDYISMDTEVEVSKPVTSDVGIDPNKTGPTFQMSKIMNTMIIKDGEAGVMGGLLSESMDRTISQPPIIGDIPIIGWFAKSRNHKRDKRNLVVVMTPHIIKEGVDYERVTKGVMDEFNAANLDVIFEQGFINKIKKKQEIRAHHYPSIEHSQRMVSDQGESQKNVQR